MPHTTNGNGTNGHSNGDGTRDPEYLEEEEVEADSDTGDDGWLSPYNPLMGPQQKWVHRPRKGYMF